MSLFGAISIRDDRAETGPTIVTENQIERGRTLLFTNLDEDIEDRLTLVMSDGDHRESPTREMTKPPREFARPQHIARFGRPLWAAYPRRFPGDWYADHDDDEVDDESDDSRRRIASGKLLAGLDPSHRYRSDDENSSLGMLSLRVGLVLNRRHYAARAITGSAVVSRLNVVGR